MTGPGVHDHRNPCSPWPESAFMMPGIGVQHPAETAFTFDRNRCSRWSGIRNFRQLRAAELQNPGSKPVVRGVLIPFHNRFRRGHVACAPFRHVSPAGQCVASVCRRDPKHLTGNGHGPSSLPGADADRRARQLPEFANAHHGRCQARIYPAIQESSTGADRAT